MREMFVSEAHVCGRCNGEGWIWGVEQKEDCPICRGCGELIAKVTIEWTARSPGGVSPRAPESGVTESADGARSLSQPIKGQKGPKIKQ